MKTKEDFYIGQAVIDISGLFNGGRPVTVNAIQNNEVEVNWFEGDELVSKIGTTASENLKALK